MAQAPDESTGPGLARYDEVLRAAIEVFWKKGYSGASVQDVADAVGLLKGSLYHYVRSKEDLLFRILDAAHQESIGIMEQIMALDATPLERLHAQQRLHVEWYLRDSEHVGVFFRDWRFLTGDRLELVQARRRGYGRFLRDLIERCMNEGVGDPELDSRYASFYILGALNSSPQWYREAAGDRVDTVALAFADMAVSVVSGTSIKAPAVSTRL